MRETPCFGKSHGSNSRRHDTDVRSASRNLQSSLDEATKENEGDSSNARQGASAGKAGASARKRSSSNPCKSTASGSIGRGADAAARPPRTAHEHYRRRHAESPRCVQVVVAGKHGQEESPGNESDLRKELETLQTAMKEIKKNQESEAEMNRELRATIAKQNRELQKKEQEAQENMKHMMMLLKKKDGSPARAAPAFDCRPARSLGECRSNSGRSASGGSRRNSPRRLMPREVCGLADEEDSFSRGGSPDYAAEIAPEPAPASPRFGPNGRSVVRPSGHACPRRQPRQAGLSPRGTAPAEKGSARSPRAVAESRSTSPVEPRRAAPSANRPKASSADGPRFVVPQPAGVSPEVTFFPGSASGGSPPQPPQPAPAATSRSPTRGAKAASYVVVPAINSLDASARLPSSLIERRAQADWVPSGSCVQLPAPATGSSASSNPVPQASRGRLAQSNAFGGQSATCIRISPPQAGLVNHRGLQGRSAGTF